VSEERDADEVFDALCSDHAREILVAATGEPRTAAEFAQRCDVSLPTVYRHVEVLVEQDLLEENEEIDVDGNHYTAYLAALDSILFELEGRGFVASVRRRMDIVDRFGELWHDLGSQTPRDPRP
jgi:DNA-binding transcriptional ArsR family regulator